MVHKRQTKKAPKPEPTRREQSQPDDGALKLFLDSIQHVDRSVKDEEDDLSEAYERAKKKRKEQASDIHKITLDLHRLTLVEACCQLDQVFRECLELKDRRFEITVITGKGRHSGASGGGVLSREMHRYVTERYQSYIVSIESSPHETALDGTPWRGHFKVIIWSRRSSPGWP